MPNEKVLPIDNISGGIQRKTTKFTVRPNEVEFAVNADFSRIGGVQKVKGYSQKGNDFPTTSSTSTSTSTSTSSSSSSTSSTTTMP